jgi:hypothetical protein
MSKAEIKNELLKLFLPYQVWDRTDEDFKTTAKEEKFNDHEYALFILNVEEYNDHLYYGCSLWGSEEYNTFLNKNKLWMDWLNPALVVVFYLDE